MKWTMPWIKYFFKALFVFTVSYHLSADPVPVESPKETKSKSQVLPLAEIQTFAEVFDQIKKNYVEDIDDKQLLEHAIEGMLTGLDPHSSYLQKDMLEDLQISSSGEFGGLGIEVTMDEGFIKVIAPIDDTPAHKAGILPGDLIIKLDDTPVKGLTLRDAVNRMRGLVGSKVVLTVVRQSQEQPLKFTLARETIRIKSVKSKIIDEQFGYLRVSQFQINTKQDLVQHFASLQKQNKIKGIVLDLRNNPGGVLKSAVDVADMFLDKGLIVYTKSRIKEAEMRFNASSSDNFSNLPTVVLVNAGSASGSEIVAGALQDQKRALIVGMKTFGKGSVQTVIPLNGDRALKLTTAYYLTPNGRSIQAEGIVPDIILSHAELTKPNQDGDFRYTEQDLKGHLNNPTTNGIKNLKKENKADASLATTDYQLYEALNVLKGLVLAQERKR